MNESFDSFYWLAVVNKRDPHHSRSMAITLPDRLVTTQAVLIEVLDALARRDVRRLAIEFWNDVITDLMCHVIPFDDNLLNRSFALYAGRPDKDWSLTDCVSFVVMADRGITIALTGDHHFEQAGFQIAFPP